MRNYLARVGAVFAAAALLSVGLTGTAQADKPVKTMAEDGPPFTTTVNGLCAFPVALSAQLSTSFLSFYDESGNLVRDIVYQTETDTFSANGNTLVGEPFRYVIHVTIKDGVPTKALATGVLVRVPLPNGRTFRAAGQLNFLAFPQGGVNVLPERGGSTNLDAFCAALAE